MLIPLLLLVTSLAPDLGEGFGDEDHHDTHAECTNRFEYRDELKKMYGNCEELLKLNPTCGVNITVTFAQHPPYVFRVDNNTVKGILPAMLHFALDSCCFGCNQVVYDGPYTHMQKFFQDSDVTIPIQTSSSTNQFFGHDYIHMLDVKAVNFIGIEQKSASDHKIRVIFQAVLVTWPLFATALLMAVTAGVLIWVLDSSLNENEFPNSFPRGPFEGFWWAVVSMTTVGYGDRSPRSFCARIFAMIWILIGITIFSMYSATLTSALTTAFIKSNEVNLRRKKFGVFNSTTVGKIASMKESASFKGFGSFDALMKAVQSEDVDGLAMDENLANYYFEHLDTRGLKDLQLYDRIPISGSSYGMVSYNENLTLLFQSFFKSNEDQKDSMALMGMGEHAYDSVLTKVYHQTPEIYHAQMFTYTVVSLTIATIVLAMLGVYLQKRSRNRRGLLLPCTTIDLKKLKEKENLNGVHRDSLKANLPT